MGCVDRGGGVGGLRRGRGLPRGAPVVRRGAAERACGSGGVRRRAGARRLEEPRARRAVVRGRLRGGAGWRRSPCARLPRGGARSPHCRVRCRSAWRAPRARDGSHDDAAGPRVHQAAARRAQAAAGDGVPAPAAPLCIGRVVARAHRVRRVALRRDRTGARAPRRGRVGRRGRRALRLGGRAAHSGRAGGRRRRARERDAGSARVVGC